MGAQPPGGRGGPAQICGPEGGGGSVALPPEQGNEEGIKEQGDLLFLY